MIIGLAALLLAGCNRPAATAPGAMPPPSVTVAPVRKARVVETAEGVGRTQATEDVELKARVEGYLMERRFHEGDEVEQGALLFVIEQAPYRVEVERLAAEHAKAQATQTRARLDLDRIRALRERRVASQSDLDAAVAQEREATADVAAKAAALSRARLDLGYTEIRAPFAGRIGRSEHSIGDFLDKESDPLATLVALDPIYVYWKVSEDIPLDYRLRLKTLVRHGRATFRIVPRIRFPDGTFYAHEGHLDFLDNRVDPDTGTQLARAVFPNPDRVLLPGQYVNVVVEIGEATERLLIPQPAVQQDRAGYSVLVVGADHVVAARRVRLGAREGVDWIVEEGLAAGERVIVQGLQKAQPGITVVPVTQTSQPSESG